MSSHRNEAGSNPEFSALFMSNNYSVCMSRGSFDAFSRLREQQGNNPLLAAAVKQQLAASILRPLHFVGSSSLASDLASNVMLSRSGASTLLAGVKGAPNNSFYNRVQDRSESLQEPSSGPANQATQIPCQARGMSTDHNSLTAYFEVGDDASHGQHLYCSHTACRAAGVKFRYCFFCKKPVTKQNFRSRHLHADLVKESSTSPDRKQNTVQKKRVEACESGKPNFVSDSPPSTSLQAQAYEMKRKDEEIKPPSCRDDTSAITLIARRRRWSTLLQERPKIFSAINDWLAEVVAVSDRSAPFDVSQSFFTDGKVVRGAVSLQQQSKWNALFDTRPQEDGEASVMTSWLAKVVGTSCPDFDPKPSSSPFPALKDRNEKRIVEVDQDDSVGSAKRTKFS